ncbi:IS3 family transposase [Lautropia mirabilis]|uniref:IS3 family transposase n=1 Tax=Lautropia mirabilis TaxID=47671 RepID=UPI0036F214D3
MACRALEVSRSGYLAWLKRRPSQRAKDDERLRVHIRAAHEAGRQTYGVRRVHALLRHQGQKVGRDRVGRLGRGVSQPSCPMNHAATCLLSCRLMAA